MSPVARREVIDDVNPDGFRKDFAQVTGQELPVVDVAVHHPRQPHFPLPLIGFVFDPAAVPELDFEGRLLVWKEHAPGELNIVPLADPPDSHEHLKDQKPCCEHHRPGIYSRHRSRIS